MLADVIQNNDSKPTMVTPKHPIFSHLLADSSSGMMQSQLNAFRFVSSGIISKIQVDDFISHESPFYFSAI